LTLHHLFQRCQEQILTLHAYHDIGGIKGVLARHAEATYLSLPTQKHQQLGQVLFTRLINLGTQEMDMTKHRVPLSAFTLIDPVATEMLAKVIEIFTNKRLLTLNTFGKIPTVELSHEALIDAWDRLQDWLLEARDAIRLQQMISTDATKWKQHKQSSDHLYRGSQLVEALDWRDTNTPNIDEDVFLQASVEEQQRIQALEHIKRQHYTRRLIIISGIGVAGTIGTGFLSSRIIQPNPQQKNLLYAYKGHTNIVESVAWSPDNKYIASASADKTVHVWDANNGVRFLTYASHTSSVLSVAWSPDGKYIASASADKTVHVWDANHNAHFFTYTGHSTQVNTLAWSPDGKYIASAGVDNTVRVWNANNGSDFFTYPSHTSVVFSVIWSPDSKRIAFAGFDNTVQVWNANNGSDFFTYRGHTSAVFSVIWSPDGKYIASAGSDNTVQVWDANNGARILTYTGHSAQVDALAWSPDGTRIASAGADSTVQVW